MAAGIFTAHSELLDTRDAVAEVAQALPLDSAEFVLLLHGPNHTGDTLETALSHNTGARFFGCSTAGEIVPGGYRENTLSAISFDRSAFSCVSRKIENVKEFGFQHARDLVLSMQWELHG